MQNSSALYVEIPNSTLVNCNCKLQLFRTLAWFHWIRESRLFGKHFEELPRKLLLNFSSPSKKQVVFSLEAPLQKTQEMCVKISWRMPEDHIICKIELILHIFDLRKHSEIKSSLINILQSISILITLWPLLCMQYRTLSPWVSSILAIISCITLGWLSWCQANNIAFLNRALVDLCRRLPAANMEESLDEE